MIVSGMLRSSQPEDNSQNGAVRRVRRESLAFARRRARFHAMVVKAINGLPAEFRRRLENIDIVVADWPDRFQLAQARCRSKFGLLGLYEGVPRTRRDSGYNMTIPDKITIFRKPIEARCKSWAEIEKEVEEVVRHEVAHHFGISDNQLKMIAEGRSASKS